MLSSNFLSYKVIILKLRDLNILFLISLSSDFFWIILIIKYIDINIKNREIPMNIIINFNICYLLKALRFL